MNNKGQTLILKFMIGIAIIVVVLALAPLMSEMNVSLRDASNMDCDNVAISNFDKLGCLSADASLFLIVGVGLLIGFAIFATRRIRLK
ncbi:hypothetical protein LCGC14_0990580 [marine sediment metagenome]|uniref:Uncharacterized protein n=1 Tax=marine sediment metagenome TaxID=412755 RepID=A0A0F9RCI5_9ZZZZ